jgi:hypothetical protein
MAFFGARADAPLIQPRHMAPTIPAMQPMLLPPAEDLDGHVEDGRPNGATPENDLGQTDRSAKDAARLHDIFRCDGERLRPDQISHMNLKAELLTVSLPALARSHN